MPKTYAEIRRYHRSYSRWWYMHQRCYNPRFRDYKWYGARGIKVCAQWGTFAAFHADMGDAPKGKSLDRIDNDKDYCPENCRWATQKEQTRNTRRNYWITANGETMLCTDWAIRLGTTSRTITNRIRNCGWTEERAVTEPIMRRGK